MVSNLWCYLYHSKPEYRCQSSGDMRSWQIDFEVLRLLCLIRPRLIPMIASFVCSLYLSLSLSRSLSLSIDRLSLSLSRLVNLPF